MLCKFNGLETHIADSTKAGAEIHQLEIAPFLSWSVIQCLGCVSGISFDDVFEDSKSNKTTENHQIHIIY